MTKQQQSQQAGGWRADAEHKQESQLPGKTGAPGGSRRRSLETHAVPTGRASALCTVKPISSSEDREMGALDGGGFAMGLVYEGSEVSEQGSFIQWAASVTPEPFKLPTHSPTLLFSKMPPLGLVFAIQLLYLGSLPHSLL